MVQKRRLQRTRRKTREEEKMTNTEKRIYYQGYWEALESFGIWSGGLQYIGCQNTPIRDVATREWDSLFPDCECAQPMEECEGCRPKP